MRRRATVRFLVVYFALVWVAVVIRVDRFPLTWAPMYSTFTPHDVIEVRMLDDERMMKGLMVTRANGQQDFVTPSDLNLPKWNFWRLYGQRMSGRGPVKHRQGNAQMSSFNRAWRGLGDGEVAWEADWARRILRSVNHTLGLAPGDPDFIVQVEVLHHVLGYDRTTLDVVTEDKVPRRIEWEDAFGDGWGRGSL